MNTLAHDLQNARPIDVARERVESLIEKANDWIARVPEITNEDIARRADDFLNQIQAELKKLAAEEKAEKKPHRDRIAEIGAVYSPLSNLLEVAKGLIGRKVKAWLDRKQISLDAEKKLQQEQAILLARKAEKATRIYATRPTVEKAAAAQAAHAAAVNAMAEAEQPVARAQIRGDYSQRARSIRVLWRAEIEDWRQVHLYYLDHPDLRETLQRLANAEAPSAHRERREIPGCRLIEKEITA